MCALVQHLLDPHYRTITGLIQIIEKDWLSFGHQFHRRFGAFDMNYSDS